LRLVRRSDPVPILLVARRHLEPALAHARQGQDTEVGEHLARVERIGPQVLRYNQQAQQLDR
jgi:hypothetical protein